MKINKISCRNINNFETLDLNLCNFNVIIGLNGSGKSSFIMLFKIIKNILASSCAQAITNEGGTYTLRNFYMQTPCDTSKIGFNIDFDDEIFVTSAADKLKFRVLSLQDEIEWDCGNPNDKFAVRNERFSIALSSVDNAYTLNIIADRIGDAYKYEITGDVENFFPHFKAFRDRKFFASDTLIHYLFELVFNFSLRSSNLCKLSIYEFEQDLLTEFRDYENYSDDDASHEILFKMMKKTLDDDDKKRSFFNFLNYVLPDIEDISFETKQDNMLVFIKEKFSAKYIPVNKLSDGTIFLVVIILVLYFDDKSITIFDEPERRIHPHLISKVIDMMKDVSEYKQLIISTHNSEIVRNVDPSHIFHIKKGEHGNSIITNPA